MVQEQDFIKTIEEFNSSGTEHTFAELIAKVLKDKVVEIYVGDSYEDVKYDDSTQKYCAVVVGKVVTAYAECLVLNCAYMDQATKNMRFGNIIALNERGIRFITEVDDTGILKDTFLSSRDAKIVKDLLTGGKR